MTKRTLFLVLGLALPVAAEGPDDAKPKRGPEPVQRFLKRHDKDADGQLSRAEYPEDARPPFDKTDSNGDGFLDKTELGAVLRRREPRGGANPEAIRRMAAGLLQRLDKNGDKQLTPDEFPENTDRLNLKKADQNGDGAVDLMELTLVMTKRARGDNPGRMLGMVKRLDTNQDGFVDQAEWGASQRPLPEQLFARLDQDKDGKVSMQELKAASRSLRGDKGGFRRLAQTLMKRFDGDRDGKISKDEWQMRPEVFGKLDANQDGFLTVEELAPRGPRSKKYRGQERTGKDSAHFLGKFDKNRDGRVTKEEFPHERRFAEIDADGDGVLSEAEVREAMDKKHREETYNIFERFDLDNDGKITREEFTGPAAGFERLDKNNDGVIDAKDGHK